MELSISHFNPSLPSVPYTAGTAKISISIKERNIKIISYMGIATISR